MLGDYASAEAWLARSMREDQTGRGPCARRSGSRPGKADMGTWGDGCASCSGMRLLAPPAESAPAQPRIRGALLARGGEYEAAIRHLEPIVDPDAPEQTYIEKILGMYALPALTWSYLRTGADERPRACSQARRAGVTRNVPQDGCAMGSGCTLRRDRAAAGQHGSRARWVGRGGRGWLAGVLPAPERSVLGGPGEEPSLSCADGEGEGGRGPAAGGGRGESTRVRTSSRSSTRRWPRALESEK